MVYLLLVVLLFCALVATHIFFCRRAAGSGLQAKAFVVMAFVYLGLYAVLVSVIQYAHALDPYSLWGMPFRISAAIVFILLVPVYLCFYVLTQLTSPSKKILSVISHQGELSFEEILARAEKEDFIMTRIHDLLASGCVAQSGGRYVLTSEGRKIALILNVMQFILGRNVGG